MGRARIKTTPIESPKEKKPKPLVPLDTTTILGIDYSYEECGFSVYKDGQFLAVDRLNFKEIEDKYQVELDHQDRRTILAAKVRGYYKKYQITSIVLERIRQFSQGFVSMPGIIAFAELIVTIIDCFPKQPGAQSPVGVYSVDVRVWKKRILGAANKQKADAVKWAKERLTFEIMEVRQWREITHNEADAMCLSQFGTHPDAPKFIIRER